MSKERRPQSTDQHAPDGRRRMWHIPSGTAPYIEPIDSAFRVVLAAEEGIQNARTASGNPGARLAPDSPEVRRFVESNMALINTPGYADTLFPGANGRAAGQGTGNSGNAGGDDPITIGPSASNAPTQLSGSAQSWQPSSTYGRNNATGHGGYGTNVNQYGNAGFVQQGFGHPQQQPFHRFDFGAAGDYGTTLTGVSRLGSDRTQATGVYQPPAPTEQSGYGHSSTGYRRSRSPRAVDRVYRNRETNPQGSYNRFPEHGRIRLDDNAGTQYAPRSYPRPGRPNTGPRFPPGSDDARAEPKDEDEDDNTQQPTPTRGGARGRGQRRTRTRNPNPAFNPSKLRIVCDRCRVLHRACNLLDLEDPSTGCEECKNAADTTAWSRCILTQANGTTELSPARTYKRERDRKAAEKAAQKAREEAEAAEEHGDAEVDDGSAEDGGEEDDGVEGEEDEGEGDEENEEDVMDEDEDIKDEESEDGESEDEESEEDDGCENVEHHSDDEDESLESEDDNA